MYNVYIGKFWYFYSEFDKKNIIEMYNLILTTTVNNSKYIKK